MRQSLKMWQLSLSELQLRRIIQAFNGSERRNCSARYRSHGIVKGRSHRNWRKHQANMAVQFLHTALFLSQLPLCS